MPADSNPYPPETYDASNAKELNDSEMGDPSENADELESDPDLEDELDAEGGGGGDGHRTPGDSLLPPVRVENIIQTEGVTGNLAMSKEAVFVLSVATEEFVQKMSRVAELQTRTERRSTITYKDIASVTEQYQEFFFLRDTIPPPLTLVEALRRREEKQKELADSDPALISSSTALAQTATNQYPNTTTTTSSHAATRKPRNHADKPSGKVAIKDEPPPMSMIVDLQTGLRGVVIGESGAESPWTRWSSTTTPKGTAVSSSAGEHGAPAFQEGVMSVSAPGTGFVNAGSWTEGYTGPFRQGSTNPGRTIYSQRQAKESKG